MLAELGQPQKNAANEAMPLLGRIANYACVLPLHSIFTPRSASTLQSYINRSLLVLCFRITSQYTINEASHSPSPQWQLRVANYDSKPYCLLNDTFGSIRNTTPAVVLTLRI